MRSLDRRENLTFELMASLDASQAERAVMRAYEGLAAAEMDADQGGRVRRLTKVYIDQGPPDLADNHRARIAATGREAMHFA